MSNIPPPKFPIDADHIGDMDREEQLALFLEYVRELSEEDQEAMLKLMQYLTHHPRTEPLTLEKMQELLQQFKRLQ